MMTAGGGRTAIAFAMTWFLPLLGLAGVGYAQSAIEIPGTIDAVDCQAQTVVLSSSSGTNTITAGNDTAVSVNSTNVPFCSLAAYVGVTATVWIVPNGSQFSATQISVTGPGTVAPPVATEGVSPVPIWGVVLGTIVVAGLVYLLVHGPDGGYYRYPYYGEYYRHYYHPDYRPYRGYYPASAPIITVAPVIAGIALGIVTVNNRQYLLSRDAGGHLYRYPYYGPYRQVYYRPTYRPYTGSYVATGAYRNAPVRQGEAHWDAPAHATRHVPTSNNRPRPISAPRPPGPVPAPVTPPAPTPAYQPPAPQRPPMPAYQPPAPQRPPMPAYQPPARQRPAGQQCGGPNQPPCPGGGPSTTPAYQPPAPQRPPTPARQAPSPARPPKR